MQAAIHHVNVTVPRSLEDATKHFYGVVMGMTEVPKPASTRGRCGAWFQLGVVQLHLSVEDGVENNSKRHVCYAVNNLSDAEERFRAGGVEILPDDRPIPGVQRFYVRDPGGNRLEIVEAV